MSGARAPAALAASALAVVVMLAAGCSDQRDYAQATAVLVDISGTYAEQKGVAVHFVKTGILPDLLPGDSLFLITIDDGIRPVVIPGRVATLDLGPLFHDGFESGDTSAWANTVP